jgi:glycosyltransferase involved in cell wall biosynthesis
LLEAVARLDNVNLILAGDGVERGALQEQAERLNISDRIRFVGWLDDRANLFQQADVCVVPSTHEPLGNVILEAWSAGCPVAAAASEGPSWLIENGKNGLLFEPNNVEQLVTALAGLRANQLMASQLGSAGRSKWGQEFQEDVICTKYIDLFERALHQNRNAAAGRRRA